MAYIVLTIMGMGLPAYICPYCHTPTNRVAPCLYDQAPVVHYARQTGNNPTDLTGRDILPGHDLGDGKYHIIRHLGNGGNGDVYLGWNTVLESPVAIKVYASPNNLEAVTAARIKHPNIVNIYDGGVLNKNSFYMVQEHLHGENLEQVAQRGMPPWQVIDYMRQACIGLEAVHRAGFVHCDVKPENLVLHHRVEGAGPQDFRPTVKIIDFGASYPMAVCPRKETVGTPQYAAPEQHCRGYELDARTDVYGLGATLYRLLSNQHPFEMRQSYPPKSTRMGLQRDAMMTQDPIALRERVPSLSKTLSEIVMKAIARSTAKRFGSALELERALSSTLEASEDDWSRYDLTDDLESRQWRVSGRPDIRIIFLRIYENYELSHGGRLPPISISGSRRIQVTQDCYLIEKGTGPTHKYARSTTWSLNSKPQNRLEIKTREGATLGCITVFGSLPGRSGETVLDINERRKFRADSRYKGALFGLTDEDSGSSFIFCIDA